MTFVLPAVLLASPGTLSLTLGNDPYNGQVSPLGSAPVYQFPVDPGGLDGTLACLAGVSGLAVTSSVENGTPAALYQLLFS